MFTRPAPKSAKTQVKFFLTRAKGSTKALAERLEVSRRTVQRYRAGQLTKPQTKLRAALAEETESEWQPQARAKAREEAATSGGMMVHVVAYFGFTASGSSDDARERHITTPISPSYAAQILQLQEASATDEDLHPIVCPDGGHPGRSPGDHRCLVTLNLDRVPLKVGQRRFVALKMDRRSGHRLTRLPTGGASRHGTDRRQASAAGYRRRHPYPFGLFR
ncbi:HTH domain-containing protein [Streptomyces sp. NPDC051642]|uniref:telomere-protecting terminal protein Tpg n=1 Tax=Streptomyces sp. NPDC051642 TaxID=3154646 RepID=UPI003446D25B